MKLSHGLLREHSFPVSPLVRVRNLFWPLPSNGRCLHSYYLATGLLAKVCNTNPHCLTSYEVFNVSKPSHIEFVTCFQNDVIKIRIAPVDKTVLVFPSCFKHETRCKPLLFYHAIYQV
jgi:hypothetical protein